MEKVFIQTHITALEVLETHFLLAGIIVVIILNCQIMILLFSFSR